MTFLHRFLPPGTSTLTARQIPIAILRAAVFGALTGPLIGLFFAWLLRTGWDPVLRDPVSFFLRGAGAGMAYALSFYCTVSLPSGFLCRRDPSGSLRSSRL